MLTAIAVSIITVIGISTGMLIELQQRLPMSCPLTGFLYTRSFDRHVRLSRDNYRDWQHERDYRAFPFTGHFLSYATPMSASKEVDPFIIEKRLPVWASFGKTVALAHQIAARLTVIMAGFRTMVIMTIALGIASFIGARRTRCRHLASITTNFRELTIAGSLLVAALLCRHRRSIVEFGRKND